MASTSGASTPFVKNLASSDRKIREQALASLQAFLSAKYGRPAAAPLRFADAYKLWAGLFYALWMADRPLPQQRLCADLAALPRATHMPDAAVAVWLRAFWATMAHQWTTGIDVLRMDKFLLLVRRVLGAQLAWMAEGSSSSSSSSGGSGGKSGKTKSSKKSKKNSESNHALALGLDVLREWPFNPEGEAPLEQDKTEDQADEHTAAADGDNDNDDNTDDERRGGARDRRPRKRARKAEPPTLHIAVGLTLHAVDIWVDELERLDLLKEEEAEAETEKADETEEADEKESSSIARRVHALVETLAAKTTAPAVRKRAREALEDERLPWNAKGQTAETEEGAAEAKDGDEADEADDDDAASWNGFNE